MAIPKNASPEEIRQYFSGNGVRWVDSFNNNNVPDEIIVEFKDRIFRGDSYPRAAAIILMYANNKRKMSKEIFDIIESKCGVGHFYHFLEVYDFVDYLSALSAEKLIQNGYLATTTLERTPNVSLEFTKLVLELEIDARQKHDAVDKMLSNEELDILPEVREYITEYFKNNYHPYYLNVDSYQDGSIEQELFTVGEYVSMVSPSRIISFFDGYQNTSGDIKKSVFNHPVIIAMVVGKLRDLIDEGNARPLSNREWSNTRALIEEHPLYEMIRDAFTSQVELYTRKEISWEEADALISDNKMKLDVLEVVLLRLDAPLWFTNKYQSKILQIMARTQLENNNRNNVLETFGRIFQRSHDNSHLWDDDSRFI